jgi:hypothetical protein
VTAVYTELRLRSRVADAAIRDNLAGKILGPADYDVLLTGPTRLLTPAGKPLCVFLPGAVADHAQDDTTYDVLHSLRSYGTKNRGLASGTRRLDPTGRGRSYATDVKSMIVGAVDPMGQQRYCRLTAWTGLHLPEWQQLQPLLKAVADNLAEHVPDRYRAQMAFVQRTHPDWVVPGTPFTTVTVNNCVDDRTTCLTREHGWTSFDRLRVGDTILAYDPATHTTRWEPVLDVFINRGYSGDMVQMRSRSFSALTTPNHRWPVQGGAQGAPAVLTSAELPRSAYWSLMRNAAHEGPTAPVYGDAFVRIVAWYITEGTLLRAGTSISLCQSDRVNPTHVDSIRRDLKELGAISLADWRARTCSEPGCAERASSRGMCNRHACAFRYRAKKDGTGRTRDEWLAGRAGSSRREGLVVNEYGRGDSPDMIEWVLTGADVATIIAAAPGKAKVPTMEFLAALTAEQAAMFVETCIAADGSPESGRFYQHDSERMGAFMAAATLAGLSVTLDRTGTHCFIRRPRKAGDPTIRINLQAVERTAVPYEGVVWCPRVPSGHWVAQRDGTVYLTGNTYPTGVHTDKGDLEEGFSTIACLRRGEYAGGQLVFPAYRVAVDMHDGDLILMDAHEWHGNVAIV